MGADDCDIIVDFDTPWGVVATGGGTNPQAWEEDVEPFISDGLFNVTIPFSSAQQQYGWVGDYPNGPVDCTGWELVARVRLNSGFVTNPQTQPGGVQVYLYSNDWTSSRNAWNIVGAPSDQWFEASVTCEAAQSFSPAAVNGIGFTFNTGGNSAGAYGAAPAEFEVDYLCWRK